MIDRFLIVSIWLFPEYILPQKFRRFDVTSALYIVLVICHWLEREQSGLFIQLAFTSSVFFSVVNSLLCILMIDVMVPMKL